MIKDYLRRNRGMLWVTLFVVIYVSYFSRISLGRLSHFQYADWDLAIYNQIFRGLLSGHPYISLLDVPWLGNHVELTMVLILPVYAIFPSPATLLVIQSLMLGLAAFPLFFIAREELGEVWGIVFAAVYLLYPAVGCTNLNEFHPESFLPFIQFFLFYFFIKRDFKRFCLFLFLCLFSKENMSLMMIAIGFYALLKRRSAPWILVPITSGTLWFIICIYGIMPPLTQGKIGFYEVYGHLGTTLPQMIGNILTHPVEVFQLLTMPSKISYLVSLLGPLSFLPCLSPSVLFVASPNLLQHLFSARLQEASLYFYYGAESMAFLFIAAVEGLKFLFTRLPYLGKRKRVAYLFILAVSLFFAIKDNRSFYIWMDLKDTPQREEIISALNRQVELVPGNASTVATFRYLPKLSNKTGELYSFHRVVTGTHQLTNRPYALPQNIEYALVDFNEAFSYFFTFARGDERAREKIGGFLRAGNWGVVDTYGDFVLLKKNHPLGAKLCERIDFLPSGASRSIVFNKDMKLAVSPFPETVFAAGEKLPLTFFWQPLEDTKTSYTSFFTLFDEAGRVVYRKNHPLTYGFYMPPFWRAGEMVKENFWFQLPSILVKGRYYLCIGLYDTVNRRFARVVSDSRAQIDSTEFVRLGEIQIL